MERGRGEEEEEEFVVRGGVKIGESEVVGLEDSFW